jgi:hypothetical protein
MTASIGIAVRDPVGRTDRPPLEAVGLLEAAYGALQLAKRKGRNRIESASLLDAGDEDLTPVLVRPLEPASS